MTARILRLLLAVALLLAAWQVGRRYLALRTALAQPEAAGFERALRWDPTNPDFHFMLAMLYRDVPSLRDAEAARRHAERAAELSPYSWRAQSQLAQLYEVAGLHDQAEHAYLRAIELNPRGAGDQWRLANFYLRAGEIDRVYGPLRSALAADGSLWGPGWTLLSKLGVGLEQIDLVWPETRKARLFLLRTLVRERQSVRDPNLPAFLRSTWQRLQDTGEALSPPEASFYLDYLLETGSADEARRSWIDIATRNGLRDEAFESGRNLVWNGRFELRPTASPLDWRITASEAFAVRFVPGEGTYGSTALRIDFAGTENLDFAGVRQRLVVQPDARLELSYQARSLELTTEEGVFLEVWDPVRRRRLLASGKVRGTNPWTRVLLSFETPPESAIVEIRLRRSRSRQIDSRLAGTLWLDNVSVKRRSAAN